MLFFGVLCQSHLDFCNFSLVLHSLHVEDIFKAEFMLLLAEFTQ